MMIRTMARYLGTFGEVAVNILMLTAMFACVLSFHNVLTRYQHSMAVAGVLPERLAGVHARHLSPHASSLVQTATAGILTIVFAVCGLDPLLQVFTWFSGIATLAIALLMAVTSVAIIVYFARTKRDRRLWHTVIAPVLGLLGLLGAAGLIAANFPMLVSDVDAEGNPAFGLTSTLLLSLIVVAAVVGFVQAAWIRARRPPPTPSSPTRSPRDPRPRQGEPHDSHRPRRHLDGRLRSRPPAGFLTATEIEAVRAVVLSLPSTTEQTRFAYVGLDEPAKGDILAWEQGAPAPPASPGCSCSTCSRRAPATCASRSPPARC
jgi:hypothetical protein